MPVALEPIGIVHSCFKEKFGIPRQAGLVREARATLELLPPFDRPEAVRGLESFSHIWIVFIFHANCRQSWKPTVRPPRLGGNRRMGVFASRSGFRPNPLGISVVELAALRFPENRAVLDIRGGDLLDGTPVVDIKPYLPYADSRPGACAGYAPAPTDVRLPVIFSSRAQAACRRHRPADGTDLQALITALLQADPRPAYHRKSPWGRVYGFRIFDLDVHWRLQETTIVVEAVVTAPVEGRDPARRPEV
jgi:tRNA-Thr(GGU) m(6)t(6)A37 methyltransferase TsaA